MHDRMLAPAPVQIPIGEQTVSGDLTISEDASALVIFAHGSGSSRLSPRNRFVARALEQRGLATLLIDLLTPREDTLDERSGELRFDIALLAKRLVTIIDWVRLRRETARLAIGLFGASTGAGAALIAASERPDHVGAVVSRGGRPDLAGGALRHVTVPTLLIVGSLDETVIAMNRTAMNQMRAKVELEIVPGATHLFEEPGALQQIAALAGQWFAAHLRPGAAGPGP